MPSVTSMSTCLLNCPNLTKFDVSVHVPSFLFLKKRSFSLFRNSNEPVKLALEGYGRKMMNEIMNCAEYHMYIATVTDLCLSMSWCRSNTQHMKTLIANHQQLVSLEIFGSDGCNVKSLIKILKTCPKLNTLKLNYCCDHFANYQWLSIFNHTSHNITHLKIHNNNILSAKTVLTILSHNQQIKSFELIQDIRSSTDWFPKRWSEVDKEKVREVMRSRM